MFQVRHGAGGGGGVREGSLQEGQADQHPGENLDLCLGLIGFVLLTYWCLHLCQASLNQPFYSAEPAAILQLQYLQGQQLQVRLLQEAYRPAVLNSRLHFQTWIFTFSS